MRLLFGNCTLSATARYLAVALPGVQCMCSVVRFRSCEEPVPLVANIATPVVPVSVVPVALEVLDSLHLLYC